MNKYERGYPKEMQDNKIRFWLRQTLNIVLLKIVYIAKNWI